MHLLQFDSEQAWAETTAALWRDRLHANPRLVMCLPSGHTPNPVFALMGQSVKRGHVSFRNTEIFALDDYGGLPADDPGRCRNMLQRYLLDHIDLPHERFHWIDTEAKDLDQICRDYTSAIEQAGGFDLTLLGIGLNGHLGLNEPGSPIDSSIRRVEMDQSTVTASAGYFSHSNLPTWGVGVGLKQLLASKEVWLLANGAKKAEIIARLLNEPISVDLPASWLREHPNSFLMVDSAAGARR